MLADGQIALIVDCDALAADLAVQPATAPDQRRQRTGSSALARRADEPRSRRCQPERVESAYAHYHQTEERPVTGRLTDMQLDALRELANISSGTAATSLSQMLGREVDLNVPKAFALPLADAVDAAGDPAQEVTGIALGGRRRCRRRRAAAGAAGRSGHALQPARRRARDRGRRLGAGRDRQHPRRCLPDGAELDDRPDMLPGTPAGDHRPARRDRGDGAGSGRRPRRNGAGARLRAGHHRRALRDLLPAAA